MSPEPSDPKLFTVQEAQEVLEKIRPMVDSMLQAFAQIRSEINAATRKEDSPTDSELAKRIESRGIAPRLLKEINGTIQAIQSYGCVVNGPEAGLVDFPCLLGSEIVFLCWKFGEPKIGHWHRIPDGFAGRRALLDPEEGPEQISTVH